MLTYHLYSKSVKLGHSDKIRVASQHLTKKDRQKSISKETRDE